MAQQRKGYAIDEAVTILRARGITSALLHGGTSSVHVIGAPSNAVSWRIGWHPPRTSTQVFTLRDAALSVSAVHGKAFAYRRAHLRARDRSPYRAAQPHGCFGSRHGTWFARSRCALDGAARSRCRMDPVAAHSVPWVRWRRTVTAIPGFSGDRPMTRILAVRLSDEETRFHRVRRSRRCSVRVQFPQPLELTARQQQAGHFQSSGDHVEQRSRATSAQIMRSLRSASSLLVCRMYAYGAPLVRSTIHSGSIASSMPPEFRHFSSDCAARSQACAEHGPGADECLVAPGGSKTRRPRAGCSAPACERAAAIRRQVPQFRRRN